MKLLKLAAIGVVSLCLAGCPTGSKEKVAAASVQVTTVISHAQDSEIEFYIQHLISDDEHKFIQQQFKSVGLLDKSLNDCVRKASSQGAAITCLETGLASVDKIYTDGGSYLKSKQARSIFELTIAAARGTLASIDTMAGGN